jgi:hypothetical protein
VKKRDLEAIVFVLALVVALGAGVWMRFFAPCGAIDWRPAAEIPARCLMR